MPYQIRKSDAQVVTLLTLDPSGETEVVLRHANGKDEMRVQEITTRPIVSYKMDVLGEVSEQYPVPVHVEQARKVWVVLESCNILDEDGEPLFTKGMTWEKFLDAWNKPEEAELRTSIWKALVEVNPHWGN
jgi:hypothetical protein